MKMGNIINKKGMAIGQVLLLIIGIVAVIVIIIAIINSGKKYKEVDQELGNKCGGSVPASCVSEDSCSRENKLSLFECEGDLICCSE